MILFVFHFHINEINFIETQTMITTSEPKDRAPLIWGFGPIKYKKYIEYVPQWSLEQKRSIKYSIHKFITFAQVTRPFAVFSNPPFTALFLPFLFCAFVIIPNVITCLIRAWNRKLNKFRNYSFFMSLSFRCKTIIKYDIIYLRNLYFFCMYQRIQKQSDRNRLDLVHFAHIVSLQHSHHIDYL